jgi:hypothetical protein
MLAGLRAVNADPHLIFMERLGRLGFWLWGGLLRRIGPPGSRWRARLVVISAAYLALALLLAIPISLGVKILLRPLLARRMAAVKAAFEAPSGSSDHRLRSSLDAAPPVLTPVARPLSS